MTGPPIPAIVQQHAEEGAGLWRTRGWLVGAPQVGLAQLARHDQRMVAHLDGLAVAGETGSQLAMAAMQDPGPGEAFVATVRALEERDPVALEKLLAVAQAQPRVQPGLVSAFGWVSAASLRGITRMLLDSPDAFRRQVGLAACAMHRVDPRAAAAAALSDADPALRVRALRVIGDCGQVDLLAACANATHDADASCADAAVRAAMLLGDRGASVRALQDRAALPGARRRAALDLLLRYLTPAQARPLLKSLSGEPAELRLLTWAVGVAGDPHFVPWLLQQMQDPRLARLAGESFSAITGLDLARLDLARPPPDDAGSGPGDDPEDEDVSMDQDDGLPWPDADRIGAWWQANGHRFAPGTRHFMGRPPAPAHCLRVLGSGFQRQRRAAAVHLCLLEPGTPLFNTATPAWRQQRWLAAMGA